MVYRHTEEKLEARRKNEHPLAVPRRFEYSTSFTAKLGDDHV
jgi:hypothetical protein